MNEANYKTKQRLWTSLTTEAIERVLPNYENINRFYGTGYWQGDTVGTPKHRGYKQVFMSKP
jgi:hypothetical protein